MHYQFAKLCTRIQNLHSPRSFDLCNETSVFCMDDVFELLSKLNVFDYDL